MRCLSCDCELSDFEATRKFEESGTFVDLCNDCLSTIQDDLIITERADLDEASGFTRSKVLEDDTGE